MANYLSGIHQERPRRWEEMMEARGLAVTPPPVPTPQSTWPQDLAHLSPDARRPQSPPSAHAMAVVEALSRPMSQERLDAKHHHMAWGSRVQTNNWPKSTAARDLPTAPGGGQDRQRQLLGQTFDPSGEKSGTTSSTTGAQGAESAQN